MSLKTATITCTQELVDAIAAGYPPEAIEIAPPAAALASSRKAGIEEGISQERKHLEKACAEAREEGAQSARQNMLEGARNGIPQDVVASIALAERTRIFAIQALTEDGFAVLSREAIEAGSTVEQFAIKVLMEKKDRGITLDAIRNGAPVAAAHGGVPQDGYFERARPTAVSKEGADDIFEKRQAAMRGGR